MNKPEIIVVADMQELAQRGAALVAEAARKAAAGQQPFSLFLSGGNTPRAMYEVLAQEPFRSQLNWSNVEIFFGDERCVPPDHPDSNFRMARLAMLDKLPIPAHNVHRIRAELPSEDAAAEYDKLLQERFAASGPDMVLLGMGDDGHTASLFPGTAALGETALRCVANFVPKFNTHRITLTFPFINRAAQVMIQVSGAGKAPVIQQVLEGPPDPGRLPIQRVAPDDGQLIWLLDAPAAGMVS